MASKFGLVNGKIRRLATGGRAVQTPCCCAVQPVCLFQTILTTFVGQFRCSPTVDVSSIYSFNIGPPTSANCRRVWLLSGQSPYGHAMSGVIDTAGNFLQPSCIGSEMLDTNTIKTPLYGFLFVPSSPPLAGAWQGCNPLVICPVSIGEPTYGTPGEGASSALGFVQYDMSAPNCDNVDLNYYTGPFPCNQNTQTANACGTCLP